MCTGATPTLRRAAGAAAGAAASVLWRLASDCDVAKLELTKAGAVAPAVAMLQAAQTDPSYAAPASEVLCT